MHRLRYREERRRLEIYKRDLCALYLTIVVTVSTCQIESMYIYNKINVRALLVIA